MNRQRGSKIFTWSGLILLAVFLIGATGGCSCDGDGNGDGNGTGLVRCQNCNDLEAWLHQVALFQMNREMESNRGGYGGNYYDDDDAAGGQEDTVGDDDDSGDDYAPPTGDDDDSNADHSDTNNQEEGVDEADIVKTDGQYLFILSGKQLMVFDPIPAPETSELSRIEIDGTPNEMFLYKDVVMVFSSMWPEQVPDDIWPEVDHSDLSYDILKITLVSLNDPTHPELLREVYVEGYYQSSRRIDASARVVIYSYPRGPELQTWVDLDEYCDWSTGICDEEALDAAYDELEAQNKAILDNTELDDWLPRYYEVNHTSGDSVYSEGMLAECSNHYHPQDPRGFGFITVMTVVMDDPGTKQPDIAVVADSGIVYASTQSLYLAEYPDNIWDWWDFEEGDTPDSTSEVHKFDIHSDANQAVYVATGSVTGFVLNQFSMSEYQGYLRVATTSGNWEDSWSNNVFVLEQNDDALDVIGEVNEIAPGEEIYSARFMQDKGYVVTFFQTDPLFTMDMADPTNPRMKGELEIPGYSSYIHPLDEDHLLTIGVPGDEENVTGGVSLQIFDVSDLTNPQQTHIYTFGEWWSAWSEAQYNHKAFLYYAPDQLLSIPVTYYGYDDYYDDDDDTPMDDDDDNDTWDDDDDDTPVTSADDDDPFEFDDYFTGFLVFNVTTDQGFTPLFAADHTDFQGEGLDDYYYWYSSPRRSVVIGDFLYTLSTFGLLVTDLQTQEDVKAIEMPWEDPWADYYDDDDMEDTPGDDAVEPDSNEGVGL